MLPNKKYTPLDMVVLARRRWAWLVLPGILGLFIALVASSRIPNVYEAETLIQIVPQRVPDSYVRTTVTIRTEDRLGALGQQVLSRSQLERIILAFNLYASERSLRPMQDLVERMKAAVTIQPNRGTQAEGVESFYIRFKYSDPVMAARVTERLGAAYVEYNARERGALADGTNQFLETQLADATRRLEVQERKLQEFRERHAGRLPTQLEYNMQAIQTTQMQRQALIESLARDRDRKLMLERLYNDAIAEPAPVRLPPNASTEGVASSASPRQQLEIARADLARLEARLKDGHPDITRARRRIAELEKQVADAGNEGQSPAGALTPEEVQRRDRISGLRAEIASLVSQISFKESEERRLSGLIAEYQGRIESMPGVESEWLSLTRDYETLQTTHRDLLTKSEAARAASQLENRQIGEQFRVLDAPRVPVVPASPQRILITAGGLGGGLLFGFAFVVLVQLKDGSLRTEEDVRQILALPVIAVIPNLLTDTERQRLRFKAGAAAALLAVAVVGGGYVAWTLKLWKFIA